MITKKSRALAKREFVRSGAFMVVLSSGVGACEYV